jgi:hypothetical protein
MNTIPEKQVGHNVFTYVDDIVVTNKNKEDHLADVVETFTSTREARLRLNPKNVCLESARARYWATLCRTEE